MEPTDASSICIRPCEPSDWVRVTELLQSVFAGEGYTSSEYAMKAYTEQKLASEGTTLVAEDSTGILGTVLLLRPSDTLSQVARDDEMEFRLLAVAPQSRGRRVGAHLVQACIDRASAPTMRTHRLVICTQPSMHAAQRLYKQLGFVRVPCRDFTISPADGSPAQDRIVYTYSYQAAIPDRDR